MHIPTLHEGKDALISWEQVGKQAAYELDGVFDDTFEDASKGRTWSDISLLDDWVNWEEVYPSWEEMEILPAIGNSWRWLEMKAPIWPEDPLSWQELQTLPKSFTVYSGKGVRTRGPEEGLSWGNLGSRGEDWEEFEQRYACWKRFDFSPTVGLTWSNLHREGYLWQELESRFENWLDFAFQPPQGMRWESLEARWLNWDEMTADSWDALERMIDGGAHRGHILDIPLYKKSLHLRIRTEEEGEFSPYLEALPQNIVPVFYREDSLFVAARKGETYIVQLNALGVDDFAGIVLKLRFNPIVFELVPPGDGWFCVREGEYGFLCLPRPGRWTGPLSMLKLKALRDHPEAEIKIS